VGQIPHLEHILLVVGVGVVVAVLLGRLRLPTLAGLLVAGALVGPSGLALVPDAHEIQILAEVGVVLLLFTVGLEFSLTRLRPVARQIALGGTLQVGLTVIAVVGANAAWGGTVARGVLLGFLFALSSTAIVLRGLGDRGEMDAPHGRLVVGVLVFQDLLVVPVMLLVPALAGKAGGAGLAIAVALGKTAIVVVAVVAASRVAIPRVMAWVDRPKSRELFTLAVLALCLGTAYLTARASLSLALGAFLAGVALADTEYGPRALGEVLPLRDFFSSLFFLSMGMLFDVRVLVEAPHLVLLLVGGLVIAKGFLATLAALAMRFPARVAWLGGVALAQFGEFGFVLALAGQEAGVLDPGTTRLMFAAGALSMFVTPILMRVAPHVSAGERLLRPLERLLGARGIDEATAEDDKVVGHVVVGGFGVGGRLLARALRDAGVPCLVLELDADRVRAARSAGEPVYYGDVTSREALAHARLAHARTFVLLINDPDATRRAVTAARAIAPGLPIIARSPGAADVELLRSLGADNVVNARLEASLELMARVLRRVGLPGNVIAEAMRGARETTGGSERKPTLPRPRLHEVEELAELKVESVAIRAGAYATGRTLADLDLQRQTGALVVAVRRESRLQQRIDPTAPLLENDILYLAGHGPSIRRAIQILERGSPGAPTFPLGVDVPGAEAAPKSPGQDPEGT
jgi:CPA2 family monovalent cation:H+ antiporter-2